MDNLVRDYPSPHLPQITCSVSRDHLPRHESRDRHELIFHNDLDRLRFVATLAEACATPTNAGRQRRSHTRLEAE